MAEDPFVDLALDIASAVVRPPLRVVRGACLFYELVIDNRLNLTVDPRNPARGRSAFETDLCVFDDVAPDTSLPRVVLEFKKSITTHDILTYSAKAKRHKQVYPYLRYGVVSSADRSIPKRFFTHNDGLDFFFALGGLDPSSVAPALATLLTQEIASSRRLEQVSFGTVNARVYRSEVFLSPDGKNAID